MIRTASTGEIMVLIQFFEMTNNRELILDHLYEKFPQITLQYVVNAKQNDTFTIKISNFIKEEIISWKKWKV
jgi:23S rRNA (uracil1939-C5)-methyltransferase